LRIIVYNYWLALCPRSFLIWTHLSLRVRFIDFFNFSLNLTISSCYVCMNAKVKLINFSLNTTLSNVLFICLHSIFFYVLLVSLHWAFINFILVSLITAFFYGLFISLHWALIYFLHFCLNLTVRLNNFINLSDWGLHDWLDLWSTICIINLIILGRWF